MVGGRAGIGSRMMQEVAVVGGRGSAWARRRLSVVTFQCFV